MKSHEEINKLLVGFVLGELSQQQTSAVQTHLGQCQKCSDELKRLQALLEYTSRISEFSADENTCESAKQVIFEAIANQEKEPTAGLKIRPAFVWRTIMKSRITKLAAAAVIIIVVLIGINYSGRSIDMATPAFAEVIKAMKKMPWMHMVSKGFGQNINVAGEQWVSFESKIWVWKNADGTIVYFDYAKHENYTYNPCSETVTISFIHQDGPPLETSSPWSFLESMVEKLSEQGAEIKRKDGDYKGKDVQIYEISMLQNGINGKLRLFIDPKKQLLIAGEVKGVDSNNNVVMYGDIEFEYPQHGPKDIYDLGVPDSAKIVKELPPQKVIEITEKYRNHRESWPPQYIAIILRDNTAEIIYRDDKFSRTETRYSKNKKDWTERLTNKVARFDSLLERWSNDDNSGLREVYLYDGKYDYYVYGLPDNPKGYRTEGHNPNHKSLDDIGWPNISRWFGSGRQIKIIENDYSTKNNLICIELLLPGAVDPTDKYVSLPSKQLYYLNPQRDFLCVRTEYHSLRNAPWQKDATWLAEINSGNVPPDSYAIKEVTEFAQTDSGKWYPKKIKDVWCNDISRAKEHQSVKTIYLNTNPNFPKGIFAPQNLPKVE